MRRKPTFEELANSTLAKPTMAPVAVPYLPPNGNTFAVTELRQMMAAARAQENVCEQYRAGATGAARDFGVPREFFDKIARGSVTEGGEMHKNLIKQI